MTSGANFLYLLVLSLLAGCQEPQRVRSSPPIVLPGGPAPSQPPAYASPTLSLTTHGWQGIWGATGIADLAEAWDEVVDCPPPGSYGGPEIGLDWRTQLDFFRGRKDFRKTFTVAEGLGPHFNETACAGCHTTPALGGRGGDVTSQGIAVHGPAATDHEQMGLRRHAAPGVAAEKAEGPVSRLRTPSLFGIGRLDAIPDSVIEAGQDPDDRDGDGIRGKVNRRGGQNRMSRFGAKANEWDLNHFIAGALRGEMGVTSPQDRNQTPDDDALADPEVAPDFVQRLDAFVRHLAPPATGPRSDAADAGKTLFSQVGCVGCHKPQLGNVTGAYTDLLLHDLGPALDNHLVDGLASGRQWRTAPLWGFRTRQRYLHDDRAASVDEVQTNHQGEAAKVSARYFALAKADRELILAFLRSL
jgi:CxxC motif-containing protein (DUF1111 family)